MHIICRLFRHSKSTSWLIYWFSVHMSRFVSVFYTRDSTVLAGELWSGCFWECFPEAATISHFFAFKNPWCLKMNPRASKSAQKWRRYGHITVSVISPLFLVQFWCSWARFQRHGILQAITWPIVAASGKYSQKRPLFGLRGGHFWESFPNVATLLPKKWPLLGKLPKGGHFIV